MSAPVQNPSPAPVITRHRSSGSAPTSLTTSINRFRMSGVSALRTSGRFSVTHATAPRRSKRSSSSLMRES